MGLGVLEFGGGGAANAEFGSFPFVLVNPAAAALNAGLLNGNRFFQIRVGFAPCDTTSRATQSSDRPNYITVLQ